MRRVRTNTPLQALTLLNDRGLVRGGAGAGGARSAPCRMRRAARTRAFRLVHRLAIRSRRSWRGWSPTSTPSAPPTPPAEGGDAGVRRGLSPAIGADAAAWTLAASVLLNLDETVTKN